MWMNCILSKTDGEQYTSVTLADPQCPRQAIKCKKTYEQKGKIIWYKRCFHLNSQILQNGRHRFIFNLAVAVAVSELNIDA